MSLVICVAVNWHKIGRVLPMTLGYESYIIVIVEKYNLKKLAPSTHLYTNNQVVEDFPGKIFTVEEAIVFNKKSIKQIAAKYPKADISARNFPLDTNALKKLSGIKDGGDKHIFATTLSNGEKMILIARNRN